MRYRTYDPRVKEMIIRSGNPNLLPDLKIPRTTALYWIHRSKCVSSLRTINLQEASEAKLKEENFKLKAKNLLMKEVVLSGFGDDFKNSVKGKERRQRIVDLAESFKDVLRMEEILEVLAISSSTYYRYRAEIKGCDISQLKCDSSFGRSLSHQDQKTMIELATSKRFAHFSTRSLAFYAQRQGLLICGIDSWYKYLRINRVVRPRVSFREPKKYGIGIRASRPNEIWHMDVTQVMTKDFKKVYLQLVVDNYSRAILSFKTGYLKDANLSLRTIRSIKLESSGETFLLSDGGGENRNVKLSRVLIGKGITQLIAKSDVAYSNSIVEAVFRQMKRVEAIRAPRSLHSFYSSIEAYVNEHNTVVPHSSLKGALPGEVFNGRTHLFDYKTHLKNLRMLRLQNQVNPKLKCKSCLVTARSADFSLTKNT